MPYRRSAELSPRALKAINYHMRGYSKYKSMELAGYADASVKGNQDKFWKSKAVKAELEERMRKVAVKTDITLERLISFLMQLAEVGPGDLMSEEGEMLPPSDIPPHIAKMLNWKIVGGKVVYESVDKLRIIELIAKLTGLSQETLTVRAEGDLATKILLARKQSQLKALPSPDGDNVIDLESEEVA